MSIDWSSLGLTEWIQETTAGANPEPQSKAVTASMPTNVTNPKAKTAQEKRKARSGLMSITTGTPVKNKNMV